MKSRAPAIVAVGATLLCASVPSGEPNPEAAKAIQQIAARRAAKEEARMRQMEARPKGEAREHGQAGSRVFRFNGAAGGAVINITE